MNTNFRLGSKEQFDNNWNKRPESNYIHWSPKYPDNQIRLAFKCHFDLFTSLERDKKSGKKFIELGAGRGSLSAYYSQNNYKVTLLDSSKEILKRAEIIFKKYKLKAKYLLGDATKIDVPSNSFDVVASIGLLEHFENPKDLLLESLRIAKKNGDIFFYVVPEKTTPLQKLFDKVNSIIFFKSFEKRNQKEDVYRSTYNIMYYKKILKNFKNIKHLNLFGVYPLPMISPDRDFPFTLNNRIVELIITFIFKLTLLVRKIIFNRNPWICEEKNGQAFLIHIIKR